MPPRKMVALAPLSLKSSGPANNAGRKRAYASSSESDVPLKTPRPAKKILTTISAAKALLSEEEATESAIKQEEENIATSTMAPRRTEPMHKIGRKGLVRDLPKPLTDKVFEISKIIPKDSKINYLVKCTEPTALSFQLIVEEEKFFALDHAIGDVVRWKLEASNIETSATVRADCANAKGRLEYKLTFSTKSEEGGYHLEGASDKPGVGRREKE